MKLPIWKQIIYAIIAPFFIFAWVVLHPRKVWQQAVKDFRAECIDPWRKL